MFDDVIKQMRVVAGEKMYFVTLLWKEFLFAPLYLDMFVIYKLFTFSPMNNKCKHFRKFSLNLCAESFKVKFSNLIKFKLP